MWRCERCSEEHEAVYTACWSCNQPAPARQTTTAWRAAERDAPRDEAAPARLTWETHASESIGARRVGPLLGSHDPLPDAPTTPPPSDGDHPDLPREERAAELEVNVTPTPGSGLCGYCRDALGAGPTVSCERCQLGLHMGCHDVLGRCPTLGCDGRFRASRAVSPYTAAPCQRCESYELFPVRLDPSDAGFEIRVVATLQSAEGRPLSALCCGRCGHLVQ